MAMTTETVWAALDALLDYAKNCGLLHPLDETFARNTLLSELRLESYEKQEQHFDFPECLNLLCDYAAQQGMIADTIAERDLFDTKLMGFLTPRPSEVVREFRSRYTQSPKAATDYFYTLSQDCNYIRRDRIAKDKKWTYACEYGELDITINLSKPEKDPREIAAAGVAANDGEKYPACQLCIENEGYPGRAASAPGGAHPARQNLRIIPLELGGERWGLQYSPYAYFNEHCIAMSAHHRPMHIDRATLGCLLDFVDTVPHYFIGSNADLPIVGGSILSHDHFQGGAHEFPMMRAATAETFAMAAHPNVGGEVLEWPLSVLRLTAASRDELLGACVHVIDVWRSWSDVAAGVIARDEDGTPHNTVTPVIRRVGERYEAYLALRCNVTTSEHPLGVFHPHAKYHHIKRENIGLIEVMGLAILPPRLVPELEAVRRHLLAGDLDALEADELTASHAAWARDVYARRAAELTPEGALDVLHEEVGAVFGRVLENAGVFKWDEAGRAAQRRFLDSL